MAPIQVLELSAAEALQALQQRPVRGADQAELATHGIPVRLDTVGGHLVLVLEQHDRLLWINAATGQAGQGVDLTHMGLRFVEECARHAGCSAVAFSTRRRGLQRKARRLGYQVDGNQMRKAIQ